MTKCHTVIKAEYAFLIQAFQSTEQTRYYLLGFLAEPSPAGGASIVATDAHVMGVFNAVDGYASAPAIWGFDKATVKACKAEGRDAFDRWLVIDHAAVDSKRHALRIVQAPTAEDAENTSPDANTVEHAAYITPIDGTFPDWRRVLPNMIGKPAAATYAANNLARFHAVAKSGGNKLGSICVHDSSDGQSPALVLTHRNDFLGVIMPVRGTDMCLHRELPAWVNPPAPQAAAA